MLTLWITSFNGEIYFMCHCKLKWDRILWCILTISFLYQVMTGWFMALILKCVDVPCCYHSNETTLAEILCGTKAIPFFSSFTIKCVSWYWVGRSDWKKKPKKENHKKSRNSRPWFLRTTLKVNIHIFGLTKCTIYCEKCSCFCSCFSLCCYYAHFSD